MVNIVGRYKHERDENIAEFSQVLGVAYIDMMGMSNSELEITRNNDEWRFETVTAIGVQTSVFTLDREYEEVTPSGVVLKNTTTFTGDSLITIFITREGNIIIRRYDFTEDGLVLKILLARSGEVAMRYFTRLSSSSTLRNIAIVGTAAVVGGGLAIAAAPLVVAAAGFTSGGIAAGSTAASMMSVLGGGATSAGGVVATLQSVGALGTVLGSTAATAAAAGTGAAAGAAVGAGVARATGRN